MRIELDPSPCMAGWGPCTGGFSHACERGAGHDGRHVCGQCDAVTRDRPDLWENEPDTALIDGDADAR